LVCTSRARGLLALGIAKAAGATTAIIREEFADMPVTIDHVCDILIGSIVKTRSLGDYHGVALLDDGLIDATDHQALLAGGIKNLSRYCNVERDPHGHLHLDWINFGGLVRDQLLARLEELDLRIAFIE